jgi:hypothetical protein
MLLLVVLALLAMFAMLAVAFVVMTGSELGTSKKFQSLESQRDPGDKTLNEAAAIVVRSSNNPFCPIGPYCLMEKIVGGDLTQGQITKRDLAPVSGGQLLTLNVPDNDPMHKVGCTMTMLSGPAAGLSTKIVGLMPVPPQQGQGNQPPSVAEILPFEGNVMPRVGDQYIINGFPYGGAGLGYNPASGLLDAKDPNSSKAPFPAGPLALQPRNPANLIPPGGANIDCTVADYQDPLLAYPTAGTAAGTVAMPIPSLHRADLIQHWFATNKFKPLTADQMRLLSFRPIGPMNPKLMAGAPDHPNFTGSNPRFDPTWDGVSPTGAQWDVDNMGRGTPDSVWVDLGFPVRFTQDGRPYKPLFAILCLDLDGRLNVNAHGSLAQTQQNYYQSTANGPTAGAAAAATGYANVSLPYAGTLPGDVNFSAVAPQTKFAGQANAPLPQNAMLIRGQGYGAAEVNLAPLFSTAPGSFANPYTNPGAFNLSSYQAVLQGAKGTAVGDQLGRYGEVAGINATYPAGAQAGSTTGGYSPLNANRWFSYNESYWMGVINGPPPMGPVLDSWGSPPDTQGFGAIGLDVAGRPIYLSMGGLTMNAPYDIDLSRNAARATGPTTPDSPFSVAELERILRSPDRDSPTLPPRLLALTAMSPGVLASSSLLLHPLDATTDQYSVPVAPVVIPEPLRDKVPGDKRTRHPVDAPAAAMLAAGGTVNWGAVADLLPLEVLQGLKMNVNTPFGAGARTSRGTNIAPTQYLIEADQPNQTTEQVQLYVSQSAGTKAEPFYYDGSGYLAGNSLAARQLYAKHLYVLMMMSADLAGVDAQMPGNNPQIKRDGTARLIAQWAVNVVAFRDHNSIMIPFSYDVYPFGDTASGKKPGWAPIYDEQHTVWGCKRPDLLISETLAFHDRRTEDTNKEEVDPANRQYGASPLRNAPGKTTDQNPKTHDPNFDQHFRPKGSLFVELYNPWTASEAQSRDLLMGAPGNPANGVYLSQITGQGGSPVWRMIIVDPSRSPPIGGELRDPDDPSPANRPAIERVVYFVPRTGISIPTDIGGNRVYTPSAPTGQSVVYPGQYAVIGSGESSAASSNKRQTLIGLDSKNRQVNSRTGRYITLDQGDLAANHFVLRNNTPAPPAGFAPSQPPVTVAVDTPHRLSVSEPVGGYGPYERTPKGPVTYNAASETYSDTIDIPLDLQREAREPGISRVLDNDGTYPHFRVIYLQRLADPTRQWSGKIGGNPNAANPYRTVDAMPVDLTTFNGVTSDKDPNNTPGPIHFEARQRGNTNAALGEFNLWKQEAFNKSTWSPNPGTSPSGYFNKGLVSSLGYLNLPYYAPVAPSPLNAASGYPGDPPAPFPWLNWAYRPFVNEYELLLVPAVSSSKLLARNDFNPRKYYGYVDQSTRPGTDTYSPTPLPLDTSYPHLLAMFQSGANGQTGQFHRVLAYLGVPTPFAHFTVQANPDFTGGPGQHWFHQPFNGIPTYREPGRINLNTISSSDVFMGLLNFHPGLATQAMWTKFFISRSGDPAKTVPDMTINAAYPSRFMRPFRSAGGAWLTPPLADGKTPTFPTREINATLMREDPAVPGRSLWQVDDTDMNPGPPASGTPTPDQFQYAAMDYNRSPYFRYQGLQKLAGATTTHSNVFAIWITVGYFEVTPATNPVLKDPNGQLVYPDGYQLGQELGADSGDVTRHRAFYIFDRSLPVGYIRGQDVNTAKGFLLQRPIE